MRSAFALYLRIPAPSGDPMVGAPQSPREAPGRLPPQPPSKSGTSAATDVPLWTATPCGPSAIGSAVSLKTVSVTRQQTPRPHGRRVLRGEPNAGTASSSTPAA